jgi:hypothetical protein
VNFPRPDVFGNYMLKDFGDIVLPADLPWWPLQPGWWVLLALLVTVIAIFSWRRYQRWRRNAYRRYAIAALSSLHDLRDLNGILKRAAVQAYPTDDSQTLWGKQWIDYLNQKTARPCFTEDDVALFNNLLIAPVVSWPQEVKGLRDRVLVWLEQHRWEDA